GGVDHLVVVALVGGDHGVLVLRGVEALDDLVDPLAQHAAQRVPELHLDLLLRQRRRGGERGGQQAGHGRSSQHHVFFLPSLNQKPPGANSSHTARSSQPRSCSTSRPVKRRRISRARAWSRACFSRATPSAAAVDGPPTVSSHCRTVDACGSRSCSVRLRPRQFSLSAPRRRWMRSAGETLASVSVAALAAMKGSGKAPAISAFSAAFDGARDASRAGSIAVRSWCSSYS